MNTTLCVPLPSHLQAGILLDWLAGDQKEISQDHSIDLGLVPPTLLDACQLTREIGIRYIWIDSLCVIQDWSDDWEQEGGIMLRVYQYAYCNIAAHTFSKHRTRFVSYPQSKSFHFTVGQLNLWKFDLDIRPYVRSVEQRRQFCAPKSQSLGQLRTVRLPTCYSFYII